MPDYTIQSPDITAVSLTPNPATQNGALVIYVTITEKTIALLPEINYSGTFYSGEV